MLSEEHVLPFDEVRTRIEQIYNDKKPTFLMRGESRPYGKINPTIARLFETNPELAHAALRVCIEANRIGGGFTGYSPRGILDVLALLQHYGWWTPLLDLTSDLEVALWFAHKGWQTDQSEPAIIHIIDSGGADWAEGGSAPSNIDADHPIIVDHDFLLGPLQDGGLNARWVRQGGYAITVAGWRQPAHVAAIDLQNMGGRFSDLRYEKLRFRFPDDYQNTLGDLYDEASDVLPAAVQGGLRILIDHMAANERISEALLNELMSRTDGIYQGLVTSGVTSLDDIRGRILRLPRWAQIAFLVWLVRLLAGIFARKFPSNWKPRAPAIIRAVEYAAAAAREGSPTPNGFSWDDIRNVEAIALPYDKELLKIPQPEDILRMLARAAYGLASTSQVFEYNTAAHAGIEACLSDCQKLRESLGLAAEPEVLNRFETTWQNSRAARWRDAPIDSDRILSVPADYLRCL